MKMIRHSFNLLFFITTTISLAHCYRLPKNIIPENYKLEILTYLGGPPPTNFNFDGKVWIQTNCVEPTDKITLHSKNLTILDKQVTVKDTSSSSPPEIKIKKIEHDESNDFLIIFLEKPLQESHKYEIFIPFKAKLLDNLTGFYRSSYVDTKTKEKHWLGVTQFEPYHARKAFPCFDEPSMKSTFDITLGRRQDYSSISNMPLLSSEPIKDKEGFIWDKYEQSVPMSTYLVAFIISDLGSKQSEPSQSNNVTFKIWARKDALSQTEFARDVGPKSLSFFENFFNIKYPLPKQDMVAIPDFSSGAMENWGLITYREAYLLFDPAVSSTTSQHRVASVIAHELAHQWFGNLVTMKWWTDLWLNEGFATYMAGLAVDNLFPHWNSLEEEAVSNLLNVFSFDAMKTSHPVSVPIGHPNEIDEIFDTISYKKGSFLLRMMSLFLGEETLRKGVSAYLIKHQYGNAEQDDLWSSLTEEAHKTHSLPQNLTVKTVMDTWTLQTGYPVVTVKRNYDANTADISQERFLRDGIKLKEVDPCWWVPLTYTNSKDLAFNSTKPKTWLSCPKQDQTIESLADKESWVLFNIQVAGVYKINYDESNWKLLIAQLLSPEFKTIPTLNRVQLIDDAADLAWTGHINYEILFELFDYLKQENEYLPWKAALSNMNALNKQLKKSAGYGNFKLHMKELLTPIYEKVGGFKLGLEKSGKLDSIKHQVLVVTWACRFEVAGCVSEAKSIFAKWQEKPEDSEIVSKDLRGVIFSTAIRHGGEKEWDFLWSEYKKSNVATEKNTMLHSLGATKELWLLNRYLEWSIQKESSVRKQDMGTVFSSVAGNDVGFYVAKNFLFGNVDKIFKHLSSNSRRLKSFLGAVAPQITSEYDYNEFEKFVKEKDQFFAEIRKGVEQNLEAARLNLQWQKKHLNSVENLLEKTVKRKH